MDATPPTPEETSAAEPREEERRLELPAWVPAAIGLTLVALAAMAVYTGFQTRVRPPDRVDAIAPFDAEQLYPEDSGGPPGSPGPGDSRVRPDGDAPTPAPLATGQEPGLSISGDASGVTGEVSLAVRRGLVFDVEPATTVIYVNDVAVGNVRQFASIEDAYEFADEGVFTVRLAAPEFEEAVIFVSAGHEAQDEIGEVSMRLQPSR